MTTPETRQVDHTLIRGDWGKWPQMLTTGVPIAPDQAIEIIRRTDAFFSYQGGNDRNFRRAFTTALRIPVLDMEGSMELREKLGQEDYFKLLQQSYADMAAWHERWGFISDIEYIRPHWVASAFIGGPHGFVHPDGKIGYVDNIGKWPAAEEVDRDWRIIAAAFPFLDIGVSLIAEEGEGGVAARFTVKDGEVTWVDTSIDVHAGHPPASRGNRQGTGVEGFMAGLHNGTFNHERGLTPGILAEWANLAAKLFPDVWVTYDEVARLTAGSVK